MCPPFRYQCSDRGSPECIWKSGFYYRFSHSPRDWERSGTCAIAGYLVAHGTACGAAYFRFARAHACLRFWFFDAFRSMLHSSLSCDSRQLQCPCFPHGDCMPSLCVAFLIASIFLCSHNRTVLLFLEHNPRVLLELTKNMFLVWVTLTSTQWIVGSLLSFSPSSVGLADTPISDILCQMKDTYFGFPLV